MKNTDFLIITTGWNCEQWASNCIKSVLHQTHTDWAMVVVDDGSTDDTARAIKAFDDPRITFVLGKSNQGAAKRRYDALIDQSTNCGPETVVLFLGLDDGLRSDALAVLHKIYSQTDSLVTYGNWQDLNRNVNKLGYFPHYINIERAYRAHEFISTAPNAFRYKLFSEIKASDLQIDEGQWVRNCTDVAFMWPLLELAGYDRIYAVPDPIYIYNRYRNDNTLGRFNGMKDKNRICAKLRLKPKKDLFDDPGN